MSVKDDLRSVLSELSPIIAGFKLAVIVIGYFGFGSVAKWIISHWYPFTRWVWDQLTGLFLLPELPLIVKDSLTALIFFLPLGIIAIGQRIRGLDKSEDRHRVSGAFFGFLFLFLICKDVITSIASSISSSAQGVITLIGAERLSIVSDTILYVYACILVAFFVFRGGSYVSRIEKYSSATKKYAFFNKCRDMDEALKTAMARSKKKFFRITSIVLLFYISLIGLLLVINSGQLNTGAIIGAIVILAVIVASLLSSIFFAPKKLFITTGAAVAFVLAAVLFEGFMTAKAFMETIPAG